MSEHRQVGLGRPNVSAIWHNWFRPTGEATLEEKIAIQDGKAPLPPDCRMRLDCDPIFEPPITSGKREEAGDNFKPWPDWKFELLDASGAVVQTAILGQNSYAVDGFVSIQSPESGVFQRSMGYAPIFEIDAARSDRGQLRVTVSVDDLTAPPLLFPWVSQK